MVLVTVRLSYTLPVWDKAGKAAKRRQPKAVSAGCFLGVLRLIINYRRNKYRDLFVAMGGFLLFEHPSGSQWRPHPFIREMANAMKSHNSRIKPVRKRRLL